MLNHALVIWKKIVICLVHWITSSVQEKNMFRKCMVHKLFFFICFDIQNNSAAKISTSDKKLTCILSKYCKKYLWEGMIFIFSFAWFSQIPEKHKRLHNCDWGNVYLRIDFHMQEIFLAKFAKKVFLNIHIYI